MTYSKSETASNQLSLSTKELLNLGSIAAQQQDWLQLSNYLKLLPRGGTRSKAGLFILSKEDWQTALDLAIKMLVEADFQHKWEITKLLPSFGESAIPFLATLTKDEGIEIEIRWFACQILGNFEHQLVVVTLIELLQQTTDEELIAMAGKTLTRIGKGAVQALVELLSQPKYRALAVQSLSYIRTTETIEPLLTIVIDSEPELRTTAIKALGSFHDRRVPPVLITALQDIASSVRKEAAIALGFRPELCQELSLVAHLQPLLYDLNLEVCRQAAISLGRMKQTAAATALFEALKADTTPVSLKLDVIKALCWSEIPLGIDYLNQALANSNDLISQEIITALGRVAPELQQLASQGLLDFWQNHHINSPQLKQALATSLGALRCNCARPILEQLADDEERKVKLHALCALKKLV
ncbi:HEAT repeat domain-containing protein [Pleurocapsales cyanobacterium LEGE 10410]|nr:HEAT repeat domain-containing protein [Pleurocapsales cyanobacterium LEGE 10410]